MNKLLEDPYPEFKLKEKIEIRNDKYFINDKEFKGDMSEGFIVTLEAIPISLKEERGI